jgi:hypothetical protein
MLSTGKISCEGTFETTAHIIDLRAYSLIGMQTLVTTKAAHATHARLCCTLSQRQVALHQNTGDVAQVGNSVILLDRAHRKIPQDGRDTRQQIAKLNPRQAHQFSYRKHSHSFLHRYRPRQSRPCDGRQSDGGGGCIACDRNEEEECFALAAISRRTAPNGRKKDVSGAVIDGGGECLRLT